MTNCLISSVHTWIMVNNRGCASFVWYSAILQWFPAPCEDHQASPSTRHVTETASSSHLTLCSTSGCQGSEYPWLCLFTSASLCNYKGAVCPASLVHGSVWFVFKGWWRCVWCLCMKQQGHLEQKSVLHLLCKVALHLCVYQKHLCLNAVFDFFFSYSK